MPGRFTSLQTAGALLVSALVSSCGFFEGTSGALNVFGCVRYPEKTIGAANWDTARAVNVRIRQGEYRPMVIGLTAERPYVLRIENADDSNRIFRAGEFFNAVAVGLVRINGETESHTCLSSVTVAPRSTAEIWFVAMRDGRYEFEDQALPYLFSHGASGVIHVGYARVRHVSPVSTLIVPETVPTAPITAPITAPGSAAPPPQAAPSPTVSPAPPPVEIPAVPPETPVEIPAVPSQQSSLPMPVFDPFVDNF
ncbi:MAG: hypothetical protein WD407_14295 [Rhodospirillales bacterium]